MSTSSSSPNYLPKALPTNLLTLGMWPSIYEFRRDTDIQSIATNFLLTNKYQPNIVQAIIYWQPWDAIKSTLHSIEVASINAPTLVLISVALFFYFDLTPIITFNNTCYQKLRNKNRSNYNKFHTRLISRLKKENILQITVVLEQAYCQITHVWLSLSCIWCIYKVKFVKNMYIFL